MRCAFAMFLLATLIPAQDLSYLDALKENYRIPAPEIARMENALLSNPHDLSTRARLMSYYFQHSVSQPRITHVLWVIEHHPESKLAGSPVASVSRSDLLNTRSDYEAARLLWLKQTESRPENAWVLANAGRFFAAEEPQRAEPLLLRAWQLDTADKMRLTTLAAFYAHAIAGCDFRPDIPTARNACPDSRWVQALKARLESTAPASLRHAVITSVSRHERQKAGRGVWTDPGFRDGCSRGRNRSWMKPSVRKQVCFERVFTGPLLGHIKKNLTYNVQQFRLP